MKPGPKRTPIAEQFWRFVERGEPDECWEWQGAKDRAGYGWIKHPDRGKLRAARVSFEMHKGPPPDGALICHTCDNPPCINPAHLYAGTSQSNMDDKVLRGRHLAGGGIKGEANQMVTMSDNVVAMVRRDPRPAAILAPILGVCLGTVYNWRRGTTR